MSQSSSRLVAKRLPTLARLACQLDRVCETGSLESEPAPGSLIREILRITPVKRRSLKMDDAVQPPGYKGVKPSDDRLRQPWNSVHHESQPITGAAVLHHLATFRSTIPR